MTFTAMIQQKSFMSIVKIYITKKQHEILDDLLDMLELETKNEIDQAYVSIFKKIASYEEDAEIMDTLVYFLHECNEQIKIRNEREEN